jgi:hypothetical protein
MNRNISDLLDDIQVDSVNLSPVSAGNIKEKTMNKIHQTVRYRSVKVRRVFSSIAIAALLIALSTGAVAANVFGIGDYFKSVFGDMNESQLAMLEEIGKTDMPPVTSNGTTITPLAAIGDGDWYYLALRIEAPAGTVLEQGDSYFQIWNPDEPLNTDVLPSEIEWSDETPGDNIINAVFRIGTQYGSEEKLNDGASRILRINGLWLQSPEKVYTKVLDGVWEFDIGIYGTSGYLELPVNGLKTVSKSDGKILGSGEVKPDVALTLQYMSVSPLGLRYEYTYENVDTDWYTPGVDTLEVIMKDGSTVAVIAADGQGGNNGVKYHAYFAAPVRVSEIDHIQFGDLSIPVE